MATQPPDTHRRYYRHRRGLASLALLAFLVAALASLLQRPYPDPSPPASREPFVRLLYPTEFNAHLRQPAASPDLLSVAFTDDGQIGLAVGVNGTILKSTNRGVTWTSRTSGTRVSLRSVDLATDGQTAWVVGDGGTILRSLDGGDSWLSSDSATAAVLLSVSFGADGRTGWAVGSTGTALRSLDGGASWTRISTSTSEELWSVTSSGSGATFWAVGTNGTILRRSQGGGWIRINTPGPSGHLYSVRFTANGAIGWAVGSPTAFRRFQNGTWAPATPLAPAFLWSVASGADGQNVVAVGTGGTIVRSADAGDSWDDLTADGTSGWLWSVASSPDGRSFWAVGNAGTIVYSTDGGMTWQSCEYGTYPAVWVALLVAASGVAAFVLLVTSAPVGPRKLEEPLEAFGSDQPIATVAQDSLGRATIAKALSQLLRNPGTTPPLTIAITGGWGQGKTSLMRLLLSHLAGRADAVWFNAWHHRREHHLFAALLEAVREQAVPRGMRWESWRFRWRLMELRVCRNPMRIGMAVIGLVGGMALVAYLTRVEIAAVGTGVGLLFSAARAFRIGVPSPGKLLAVASRAGGVKTFGAHLAFRHRFAEALKEVVEVAAPARLVIAIDDLDRCQPEQVVETLEAVNFLVNAVECYVVMGFARPQVLGCIGLSFRDIASELAMQNGGGGDSRTLGLDRRREYAEQYLEKLINIELRVPKLANERAKKLARMTGGRVQTGDAREAESFSWVQLGVAALLLMLLVIAASGVINDGRQAPPLVGGPANETPQSADVIVEQDGVAVSGQGDPGFAEGVADQGDVPGNSGAVGMSSRNVLWLSVVGLIAVMHGAMMVAVAGRRRRSDPMVDADSTAFGKALDIWLDVVRTGTDSPRQVKRFVNRVRLLARLDAVNGERALSDELVVGLGALQSVGRDGATLPRGLARLLTLADGSDEDGSVGEWVAQLGVGGGEAARIVVEAICEHRRTFRTWVSEEVADAFGKLAEVVVLR